MSAGDKSNSSGQRTYFDRFSVWDLGLEIFYGGVCLRVGVTRVIHFGYRVICFNCNICSLLVLGCEVDRQ